MWKVLIFLAVNLFIAAVFFMVGETWATVVGGLLVAEGIVYLIVAVFSERRKKDLGDGGSTPG